MKPKVWWRPAGFAEISIIAWPGSRWRCRRCGSDGRSDGREETDCPRVVSPVFRSEEAIILDHIQPQNSITNTVLGLRQRLVSLLRRDRPAFAGLLNLGLSQFWSHGCVGLAARCLPVTVKAGRLSYLPKRARQLDAHRIRQRI